MKRAAWASVVGAGILVCVAFAQAPGRPVVKTPPRLEPVAETKLLMEGLAQPNLAALGRGLKDRPADANAWTLARGQALLLAETGNLLLIRPPRNQGQDAWMERATELRTAASRLALAISKQDWERGRGGVAEVAVACNRCHQQFRVPVKVNPFAEAE
jgi:hypothetical protein